ncbi:MAG: hypothetical protein KGM16_17175 [Bacteroidota bacterium]|nr:hypothetical protein [Bacteroidota bacterium]
MKTISIKAFTIISVLIAVFYLLVFLSFLLIASEKKYVLSSKEILTTKDVMITPSFDNCGERLEGTENTVPTFYTKIESPAIDKNTVLILGVHNNSPSFFILRGYFSKFILGQTILKKACLFE